jgi:hypothetical protein
VPVAVGIAVNDKPVIASAEQYNEGRQCESEECRDCESTLGLTLNKTKESENQAVTISGHRFLT